MGSTLGCLKCCGNGKLPQIKVNVSSQCCRDNKRYNIVFHNEEDMDKLHEILKELHRSSVKRNIEAKALSL